MWFGMWGVIVSSLCWGEGVEIEMKGLPARPYSPLIHYRAIA